MRLCMNTDTLPEHYAQGAGVSDYLIAVDDSRGILSRNEIALQSVFVDEEAYKSQNVSKFSSQMMSAVLAAENRKVGKVANVQAVKEGAGNEKAGFSGLPQLVYWRTLLRSIGHRKCKLV